MSRPVERELLLVRGSMAVLAAVLVCSIFGFVLLANFLRVSVILNTYLGLVIYTFTRAASIVAAEAIRSPRVRALATIRIYQTPLQYWTRRIISVAAIAWWTYIVLDVLGIRTETFQAIAGLLNTQIGIRAFSIALGDILAFASVLAAGFPLAKAIRFVLREEVFSRLRLSRGVPEMLSTLVYYVALVFVFLLSISAAGVHLDKLTVLTGRRRRRRRLWVADLRQQLRLGPGAAVRAPDPSRRRAGSRRPGRRGFPHWHSLQHRPDLSGRRSHHSEFGSDLESGGQLDAHRAAPAGGGASSRGLWNRPRTGDRYPRRELRPPIRRCCAIPSLPRISRPSGQLAGFRPDVLGAAAESLPPPQRDRSRGQCRLARRRNRDPVPSAGHPNSIGGARGDSGLLCGKY